LSNWYIEGVYYQENELIRQHVRDGHEVLVIASTETHRAGKLAYTTPVEFVGPEGARVIRLDYRLWPSPLARKLRVHTGVYALLEEFRPDSILFHGTCGWEIMTAARYARDNREVLFYIDSHEDQYNSARTFLSREVLHKLYYRFCLARAWPTACKVLCVSTETMDFVEATYRVPHEKLEFFPLGGRPIPSDEYAARRSAGRDRLGIADGEILLVQSGKQTRRKKLLQTLRAFAAAAPANARLLIAGTLDENIREEAARLIEATPGVEFLGWRSAEELTNLLCAADVYLQPGTQSATMQHSLCCRCAVIIDDVPSHRAYIDGNGWLINDRVPLESALAGITLADLAEMQERSFGIATRLLDYAQLANRILHRDELTPRHSKGRNEQQSLSDLHQLRDGYERCSHHLRC
jgi:hypothetical protein